MPRRINKSNQELLVQYKITERYGTEYPQLIALGYNPKQADTLIIRPSSAQTVKKLLAIHNNLINFLSHEQITNIASHGGGSKNLEGILQHRQTLLNATFKMSQIISMVSTVGGSQNLTAAAEHCRQLLNVHFTTEAIKCIGSHPGGSHNLKAVVDHYTVLKGLGFTNDDIKSVVSRSGGSLNIKAIVENNTMLQALGFTNQTINSLATKGGGSLNLNIVVDLGKLANDLHIPLVSLLKPEDRIRFREQLEQAALSQNRANPAELFNRLEQLLVRPPSNYTPVVHARNATRPAQQASRDERLVQFKITERYDDEYQQLIDLGYNPEQADRLIIRQYSAPIVKKIVNFHEDLIDFLSHEQITNIAAQVGGAFNLQCILDHKEKLITAAFTLSHMISIVSHYGGSNNVKAVLDHWQKLNTLGFTNDAISHMASHKGGSLNLIAAVKYSVQLLAAGFTLELVEQMVAHDGGSQNLKTVVENCEKLNTLGFTNDTIKRMVSHGGGSNNLKALLDNWVQLHALGYTGDDIKRMASQVSGSLNLKAAMDLAELANELHIPLVPLLLPRDRIRFREQLQQAALNQSRANPALLFDQLEPLLAESATVPIPEIATGPAVNPNSFFAPPVTHSQEIAGRKRSQEEISDESFAYFNDF